MGTPDFAVPVLDELKKAGYTVSLVVTQPDRQKGRGKAVAVSPVKACAIKWGIPVFQPEKIKTPEAVSRLREEKADLFVVAAYGQILSEEILNMPVLGCVNVHASLLPKYRGAAPIQWAVINGEKQSGVTLMQMDRGLDTGDILLQEAVELSENETGESLYEKLSGLGGKLMASAIPAIEAGALSRIPQDDSLSCYAKMLKKEMGEVNFNEPAASIERLIRGLNSWPSAYTFWRGKQLKLWEGRVLPETALSPADDLPEGKAVCGMILEITGDEILVQTGDGILALKEVQLEGKKRMKVHDFLLGNHPVRGEQFGEKPKERNK